MRIVIKKVCLRPIMSPRRPKNSAPNGRTKKPAAKAETPVEPPAEAEVEEKDEFDVILEDAGDKKIQVIKEVRALTNLGLGEAKALVDGAPATILEGANKETADKAKAAIEEAGGTVSFK